jgi:hypothetical protein
VIKNVSAPRDTARAGDGLSVPGEFDLEVPHKGRTYRVRLVWRGGGAIGVASNAEPVRADGDLRRLERENADLRAQLRDLTERLQEFGQLPSAAA